MGTATEALRRQEQARGDASATMATTPATTSHTTRWRVAQRVLSPRDCDLVLKPVDVETLHPLLTATPVRADPASNQSVDTLDGDTAEMITVAKAHAMSPQVPQQIISTAKDQQPKAKGPTEVVALEEGELDPLGAFAMGIPLDGMSLPADTKTTGLTRPPSMMRVAGTSANAHDKSGAGGNRNIKQQWIVHKDRVLAKLSDETFTIKASMLETNDMESDLSYAPATSEYERREVAHDDPAAPSSSMGSTHVIRKSRARLEQLDRRQSSSGSFSTTNNSTHASKANGHNTVEITQHEYVTRIKQMEADMVRAWQQNLKVLALRIAIKCVKQLSDTSSAPQLYPVAFVLVSDILDAFGQLVFDRIKARASEDENGQPLSTPQVGESFTSDEINIHAKETCRNWFYKTACIRELLPRIYIEIALLKSYRFLCDGEFPQIVARLSNMIKGVGEPMVALYTRLYLALASTELVNPSEKTAVLSSVHDYFFTFQQYRDNGKLVRFLDEQKLSENDYFAIHSPAIEWLLTCTAHGASDDVFDALLEQYKEYSDNSMVLKHLCEAFGAARYAANPLEMLQLMRTATVSQFSKCHLYSVLAVQLSSASTIGGPLSSNKDIKLRFLNDAWSSITAQEDIEMYMECAAAYMKLIVAHYSHREAMILLKDVVRHLDAATPQELTPKVYNLLGALIENVVFGARRHAEFFTRMIPSSEFLSLMGMFKREASVGVAKKVLQAFVNTQDQTQVATTMQTKTPRLATMRLHVVGPEAAVAHTLFVLCCRVHDALDSLSTVTERQDAANDIVAFISRLGYAKRPTAHTVLSGVVVSDAELQEEEEALLMLYIDCRSAFYKLEPIKSFLTKFVVALALRVRERMMGTTMASAKVLRVDDRRRDFIKSCLAYAHITIPSISQPFERLELLVLCAKVSLVANCLPQMEAFLKAAIMVVADLDYAQVVAESDCVIVEKTVGVATDPVLRVINDLVQVATFAPSLVEEEPFYFVEALRKALLERMQWSSSAVMASAPDRVKRAAAASRVRVVLTLTQLYAMWAQPRLPKRLEGVDSNDILYGGEVSFHERAQSAFSTSVALAVDAITAGSSASSASVGTNWDETALQAELMMELVLVVFPYLALDEPSVSSDGRREDGDDANVQTGAVLLCKCVLFTHEKLEQLHQFSHHHQQQLQTRQMDHFKLLRGKYTEVTTSLLDYLERTMKKRASQFSETSRRASEALHERLQRLCIAA